MQLSAATRAGTCTLAHGFFPEACSKKDALTDNVSCHACHPFIPSSPHYPPHLVSSAFAHSWAPFFIAAAAAAAVVYINRFSFLSLFFPSFLPPRARHPLHITQQKKRGRPKLPPNSGASAKRTSLSAAAGSAVSTPAPSPRRKPIALATTMSSLSTASGNAIASPHGGPSSSLPSPAIPTSASSSSSSSSYFSRGPVPSSSSAAPSLFPPDFSLSGPSSSSYPPRIVTLATTTEFLIIRSSESSVPLLGLSSSRLRESWLGSMLSAEDMLALDPVREWLTAPPGLVLTTSTETVALVEELSEQAVESPAAGTPYPDRDVTVKRSDGAWTDFNLRMHLGRGAGLDLR